MLDKEETRLRAHGTTSLLLYTSLRSAGPVLVCDTKHFPRKGCRHMRIQNWGWTHIQLTGKENVSMYYCTVLYCTTILLHTLFTLVLYLSMYTRTHPKHTRGTNPFSAISPRITFLVIVDSSSSSVLSLIHYCTIRHVSKPPM